PGERGIAELPDQPRKLCRIGRWVLGPGRRTRGRTQDGKAQQAELGTDGAASPGHETSPQTGRRDVSYCPRGAVDCKGAVRRRACRCREPCCNPLPADGNLVEFTLLQDIGCSVMPHAACRGRSSRLTAREPGPHAL